MRYRRLGIFIMILGVLLVLFPLGSIFYNGLIAERNMASFLEQDRSLQNQEVLLAQANAYNASLDGTADGAVDPFLVKDYVTVDPLDFKAGEVFGYVSIPKIEEYLPIYLGATDYHLSIGTAQISGTDLPIGGEDTRAVIAGHRGYSTHTFFLNLDALEAGDKIYIINVLGQTLVYEVYHSEIIAPSEYQKLAVVKGQDTLTLLTCTTFLPDSDRLLVNARRVMPEGLGANDSDGDRADQSLALINAEKPDKIIQIKRFLLGGAVVVLILALIVLTIRLMLSFRRPSHKVG